MTPDSERMPCPVCAAASVSNSEDTPILPLTFARLGEVEVGLRACARCGSTVPSKTANSLQIRPQKPITAKGVFERLCRPVAIDQLTVPIRSTATRSDLNRTDPTGNGPDPGDCPKGGG